MRKRLFGVLRDRGQAQDSGSAAVELAIVAPLLIALALGIADYGDLMNSAAALMAGTRSGAEVAQAKPNVTAAQLTALNIVPSGVTFPSDPTFSCTCIDNTSEPVLALTLPIRAPQKHPHGSSRISASRQPSQISRLGCHLKTYSTWEVSDFRHR